MTPSCALQIMLREPEAKLLLCAPQNYSADLLASALRQADVTPADMLRLNDPRLPPNQVGPLFGLRLCCMPTINYQAWCLLMIAV